jgi:hypothetical protein
MSGTRPLTRAAGVVGRRAAESILNACRDTPLIGEILDSNQHLIYNAEDDSIMATKKADS